MQSNSRSWIARTVFAAASLMIAAAWPGSPAAAGDFFSDLFGGFTSPRHQAPSMPFGLPFGDGDVAPRPRVASGSGAAYCVRTCDGRYFPISATGGQSKAETCQNLCPASETRVVFGRDIDSAATETGKPYSALPNAFRYRTELVSGCTCNGKTTGGLAHIDVANDPTLRKGDLVATGDGTLVANGGKSRQTLKTSPAEGRTAASRFTGIPVMAAQ